MGCHRQSNTFPACTRRLAQEKSQETGLEGTKGKVEREMSGVGRDMGRCVKQISSSLCRGRGAAFIPSAMATTFPWNNARLDFAALPIHADRIGGYLLHEHFSARWSHLISRNFGSSRKSWIDRLRFLLFDISVGHRVKFIEFWIILIFLGS